MTLLLRIAIFLSISCTILVIGYIASVPYPDLLPRIFSLKTSSIEPPRSLSGVMINLPRVVAPVDDGQEFYYVQAHIALEIDHAGTATLIRARHEMIDRHLLELFHTYSVKDLRAAGQPYTIREDIKRIIGRLLPKGHIHKVYITNWVMIPAEY